MKRSRKIFKEEKEPECIRIINFDNNSKRWLVEWKDFTRSWENFESLKNYKLFQLYIENTLKYPEYIT